MTAEVEGVNGGNQLGKKSAKPGSDLGITSRRNEERNCAWKIAVFPYRPRPSKSALLKKLDSCAKRRSLCRPGLDGMLCSARLSRTKQPQTSATGRSSPN